MINKECHAILLKCMVEGLQINQLKSEKEKKKKPSFLKAMAWLASLQLQWKNCINPVHIAL